MRADTAEAGTNIYADDLAELFEKELLDNWI
jgi:hypothetical protein